MEGVTETKFGAETKGWTMKRLPYPGIHPIISFQTLTTLHTLARFCWKDPDIAVSCENMTPGPNKHRSGCSQSAIGWITRPPMEELEKVPKELQGVCNPIGGTTIWTNLYAHSPRAHVSSCICIRRWPSRPSVEREAHWSCKLYLPQYRGTPGPKSGSGGSVWGTFGIALEM